MNRADQATNQCADGADKIVPGLGAETQIQQQAAAEDHEAYPDQVAECAGELAQRKLEVKGGEKRDGDAE
ncbi:hypothetical protein Q3A80_02350 [Burkholderia sp. SR8]|uniref:hypothetical protein n=1 Tax=Burkholderia sp. SR8 TaxID=3062277 RepID=UPI004063ABA5